MDDDDRLQLDYRQTTELYRVLVDVRFKLLALVPTIAGAAVGLLGSPRRAAELVAVGALGLTATLGVFLYELRNSEVHDGLVQRAKELERRLMLPSVVGDTGSGGVFGERPAPSTRLFGLVAAMHERGLALVYGAALAGWTYLFGWGALGALGVPGARWTGAAIGVAVGALVVVGVQRIDQLRDAPG